VARVASAGGAHAAAISTAPPPRDEARTDPPPPPAIAPPPAAVASSPARLADEIALLDRAEAAVSRGDFRGALAQLGEHYRRFPAGTLTQEAEVLRIRALLGAGRRDDAQARARRFLGLHSDGVLAAKVRSLLAGAPPAPTPRPEGGKAGR
jgi:TolA-binding protein